MSNTVWKYHNKTTGKEIECNDLSYLLLMLSDDYGLEVPRKVVADLMLKGKTQTSLQDDEGNTHSVVIGEHSPERGILFQAV